MMTRWTHLYESEQRCVGSFEKDNQALSERNWFEDPSRCRGLLSTPGAAAFCGVLVLLLNLRAVRTVQRHFARNGSFDRATLAIAAEVVGFRGKCSLGVALSAALGEVMNRFRVGTEPSCRIIQREVFDGLCRIQLVSRARTRRNLAFLTAAGFVPNNVVSWAVGG